MRYGKTQNVSNTYNLLLVGNLLIRHDKTSRGLTGDKLTCNAAFRVSVLK